MGALITSNLVLFASQKDDRIEFYSATTVMFKSYLKGDLIKTEPKDAIIMLTIND
jgi:hypothetical protein